MKRLLSFLLALLMLVSFSVTAFAEVPAKSNSSSESETVITDEPTRQEETVWHFRIYQGRLQMRLWSLTYERWLTDWIDVGPA